MARKPSATVSKRDNGQLIHIEAPGCIVNIRLGLSTVAGQEVTAITIQCDNYAGEAAWTMPDFENARHLHVRVVKEQEGSA
jgi:hypothetical protein